MQIWKHKEWQTHKGVWAIYSDKLSDEDIAALIVKNPTKYGELGSWTNSPLQ